LFSLLLALFLSGLLYTPNHIAASSAQLDHAYLKHADIRVYPWNFILVIETVEECSSPVFFPPRLLLTFIFNGAVIDLLRTFQRISLRE
jgi:hypothetical protein